MFPHLSNQIQSDGTCCSASQQVMPSNPCNGNSGNLLPNTLQIQSQMGLINPQTSFPFNNSNTHSSNGHAVAMPNRPPSVPPPAFMNIPNNHFLPMQNSHMGMSILGSGGRTPHPGQCHGGFSPQNCVQNLNSMHRPLCNLVQNVNQINPSQPPGQLFAHNWPNMPQQFNQYAGFPDGQFCLQNPMLNMNQFATMQMLNPTQVVPYNVRPMVGCPNQVTQTMGPQNPTFIANPQFGSAHYNGVGRHVNQDQHKLVSPTMDVNGLKQSPISAQQSHGNPPTPHNSGSVQPQQTQKNFGPSVFTRSQLQGNHVNDGGINSSNSNWKNSPRKNFMRNPKREASHSGFRKPQFHHMQNVKGKSGFFNENRGKVLSTDGAGKCGHLNSTNQARVDQRRSLSLNYTEQEIQQWREERKKNYPSKPNIEKKLTEKLTNFDIIDREAKLRRQQLKEILAKQAELGCEVAEIPSYYLSDSEKQMHGMEENKRALTKRERFQNKYNKRGRRNQNDRFSKKQRLADKDSSGYDQNNRFSKKEKLGGMPSLNKMKPTLLQKLLGADIRRDKSRLLQVFRFMVMNSFFKDWPEKPLKFPLIIVKESGCEGKVVEEKSSLMRKVVSEGISKVMVGEVKDVYDDVNNAQVEEMHNFVTEKGSIGVEIEKSEEEEGEIID